MIAREVAAEYVRSYSLRSGNIGADGWLLLKIAEALGGSSSDIDGCPIVHIPGNALGLERDLCFFVSQPRPNALAECLKTSGFRFFGYVSICEDYASSIRFLCLRLCADADLTSTLGDTGQLYFPKAARSEIPWGLESLWFKGLQSSVSGHLTAGKVPDWYEDALKTLSPERRTLFEASVSFALLFTILHELGHFKYRHFDQRTHLPTLEKELEADSFAIGELLRTCPSPESAASSDSPLLSLAVGLAASMILFHVFVIQRSPHTAGHENHCEYPTAAERLSRVITFLIMRKTQFPHRWLRDLTTVITLFHEIASLHPAFSFVIGTSWMQR